MTTPTTVIEEFLSNSKNHWIAKAFYCFLGFVSNNMEAKVALASHRGSRSLFAFKNLKILLLILFTWLREMHPQVSL